MDAMTETDLVDVTITGPDADWMAGFVRQLVEARMVACGNIIRDVRSVYRWEGEIEEGSEALVVLHTRASRVDDIIEYAKEAHPDDVPQVIAVPVTKATPDYHQWVLDETA